MASIVLMACPRMATCGTSASHSCSTYHAASARGRSRRATPRATLPACSKHSNAKRRSSSGSSWVGSSLHGFGRRQGRRRRYLRSQGGCEVGVQGRLLQEPRPVSDCRREVGLELVSAELAHLCGQKASVQDGAGLVCTVKAPEGACGEAVDLGSDPIHVLEGRRSVQGQPQRVEIASASPATRSRSCSPSATTAPGPGAANWPWVALTIHKGVSRLTCTSANRVARPSKARWTAPSPPLRPVRLNTCRTSRSGGAPCWCSKRSMKSARSFASTSSIGFPIAYQRGAASEEEIAVLTEGRRSAEELLVEASLRVIDVRPPNTDHQLPHSGGVVKDIGDVADLG